MRKILKKMLVLFEETLEETEETLLIEILSASGWSSKKEIQKIYKQLKTLFKHQILLGLLGRGEIINVRFFELFGGVFGFSS